jgi:hypothetical protein
MDRRKFMLGLGSLAAGGAAAMGTGAFSRVQADRNISVDVVGDANAFLGVEQAAPTSDSNYNGGNEPYVEGQGNPTKIALNFDDPSGVGGNGISDRALWVFEHLLTITNQGTQPVQIGIDFLDSNGNSVGSPGDVGIGGPILRGEPKDLVTAPNYDGYGPGPLQVGDSVNMGVFFNLSKQEDFDAIVQDLETMVIAAEAV